MTNTAKTMTIVDLTEVLDTDARTARKFLRSITPAEEQPGKGSRWVISATAANLKSLTKKFADFEAARAAKVEDDAEVEAE